MSHELEPVIETFRNRIRRLEVEERPLNLYSVQLSWDIGDFVSVLPTGIVAYRHIYFAGRIYMASLVADQPGNIVMDVWKDSFPNVPTVADTITAAAKPTLVAAQTYIDTTLTGWDRDFVQGDVFGINIDSVATITFITLTLGVVKT